MLYAADVACWKEGITTAQHRRGGGVQEVLIP